MLQIVSRPVGGGALAQLALTGRIDQWYARPPDTPDGWRALGDALQREFADRDWRAALAPAFAARGAAAGRLAAADVVVTTGQQPGLFGGPLYTLHKALTALALANAIERETGLRVAPVFWAATDDSDFAEASHAAVVVDGELRELAASRPDVAEGVSMSGVPLGDVSAQRDVLERACGSAASETIIEAVRAAYRADATVGGAYLDLLRALLEPLGIAVLDASHPAVRTAAAPALTRALTEAPRIAEAVATRTSDIDAAGMTAQVAHVPELSLVFTTGTDGVRRRIAIADATRVARDATAERLSPNVLLRPIVERQILPTLTYVGGPGEIAYFAQTSAVAGALGVAVPLVVPRWSGFIVEPEVARALDRLGLEIDDLRDPHAAERRVARGEIPVEARAALQRIRDTLAREAEALAATVRGDAALARSVGSMKAGAEFKLERLERRLAAATKRGGTPRLRDVRLARGSLYPNGTAQERVLAFAPYLARYGGALTDAILAAAGHHASIIVKGV